MAFLFDSRKKYVMERRGADGVLDLKGAQPPFFECTADQISGYYFANGGPTEVSAFGHGETASQEMIVAWYRERGWFWREKTW